MWLPTSACGLGSRYDRRSGPPPSSSVKDAALSFLALDDCTNRNNHAHAHAFLACTKKVTPTQKQTTPCAVPQECMGTEGKKRGHCRLRTRPTSGLRDARRRAAEIIPLCGAALLGQRTEQGPPLFSPRSQNAGATPPRQSSSGRQGRAPPRDPMLLHAPPSTRGPWPARRGAFGIRSYHACLPACLPFASACRRGQVAHHRPGHRRIGKKEPPPPDPVDLPPIPSHCSHPPPDREHTAP